MSGTSSSPGPPRSGSLLANGLAAFGVAGSIVQIATVGTGLGSVGAGSLVVAVGVFALILAWRTQARLTAAAAVVAVAAGSVLIGNGATVLLGGERKTASAAATATPPSPTPVPSRTATTSTAPPPASTGLPKSTRPSDPVADPADWKLPDTMIGNWSGVGTYSQGKSRMDYTFNLTSVGNGRGTLVGTFVSTTPSEGRNCRGNVYLAELSVGAVVKISTGETTGSGCHLYAKGTFELELRQDGRLSFTGVVAGALTKT